MQMIQYKNNAQLLPKTEHQNLYVPQHFHTCSLTDPQSAAEPIAGLRNLLVGDTYVDMDMTLQTIKYEYVS
jgi:hypothetical protein